MIELVKARAATRSKPNQRRDRERIALAIEGGGMRGVVAGGMVTAIERLGLRDSFDAVYGTSAGALAGAYFLAGQPSLGTSIYYEDLIGPEFISRRRFLRGQPMISMTFLERVMCEHKPLDWEAVLRSPIPLHAVATRASDGSAVALNGFGETSELLRALHASARIPLAAGAGVPIASRTFFDGSLVEPIPYRSAQRDGHTRVLVLMTRPRDSLVESGSELERRVLLTYLNRQSAQLGRTFRRRVESYREDLEHLAQANRRSAGALCSLAPDAAADQVYQLEQDPERLRRGARSGAEAVYRAFGQPLPTDWAA